MKRALRAITLVCALLGLGTLAACSRKSSSQGNGWSSNHGALQASAPPPVPAVLPPEPPLEKLRVPNSGLPCDVDEVLAAKCRRCHNSPVRHNAPFALFTWEDTQLLFHEDRPRFQVMASAVTSGFMPYNMVANPPVERLTDAEKQVIVDWAAAGAPRGTCGATPAASGSAHSEKPKR